MGPFEVPLRQRQVAEPVGRFAEVVENVRRRRPVVQGLPVVPDRGRVVAGREGRAALFERAGFLRGSGRENGEDEEKEQRRIFPAAALAGRRESTE